MGDVKSDSSARILKSDGYIIYESLKIAEIHEKRLCYAIEKLHHCFPVTPEILANLSGEDFLLFELYTSRFSKLQHLISQKIFTRLLRSYGELVDEMSFIDKLNRLEKLKIIDSAEEWMSMRQIRNHLAHEYLNHPELTADSLNQAYGMSKKLLDCLRKIRNFAEKSQTYDS